MRGDRAARRDPDALLREVEAAERARAARAAQDLPRLRVRRRQVVPAVRRGPPPSRARRGRRGRRDAAANRRPTWRRRCAGLEVVPTRDVGGVPVVDVEALLAAPPAGVPHRRARLRQPARLAPRQTLPGRRGPAGGRHFRADVDQPGVHRRTAGRSCARSSATAPPQTRPAGRSSAAPTRWWWSMRRRTADGGSDAERAVGAAPAGAPADRGGRGPPARGLPAAPRAFGRPGAPRSGSSSA